MPDFAGAPDLVLIVDQLARRYGCLPHEVLALDPWQLTTAIVCYRAGREAEGEAVQRAAREGMVFPTVSLGGA